MRRNKKVFSLLIAILFVLSNTVGTIVLGANKSADNLMIAWGMIPAFEYLGEDGEAAEAIENNDEINENLDEDENTDEEADEELDEDVDEDVDEEVDEELDEELDEEAEDPEQPLTRAPVPIDWDYSVLTFDADASFVGRYSVTDVNAVVPGVIEYDAYQVTYVANPYTTNVFPNATQIHRMNIKVPVSYDGIPFDPAEVAKSPILMYNPWGGDNGSAPPSSASVNAGGFNVRRIAMSKGWVLVEPGMRGQSHTSGSLADGDWYNYGKLPGPIVDLKAAVRYLRYGNNDILIPGDKELIFFTGSSSG